MLRAVLVEFPPDLEDWFERRARLQQDRWDELWDGVLHMNPPPKYGHQSIGSKLVILLTAPAELQGLKVTYETGVFRPGTDRDYRQPDVVVASPAHISERGVEGRAELVVEIRSSGDEAWEKLAFFAEMDIPEVLILEEQVAHLLRLQSDQRAYEPVPLDGDGWQHSEILPFAIRTAAGAPIEVRTADRAIAL